MNRDSIFSALDLEDVSSGAYAGGWLETGGAELDVENPATGERIGAVKRADGADYETVVSTATATF
ncbi:MAG: aldehyde dehydrogenase family protein, partial [Phycisphaeraceae bacterium]|nr:aldehyde dehydrogenase family protein [Phycisphaeraceae bacterium]